MKKIIILASLGLFAVLATIGIAAIRDVFRDLKTRPFDKNITQYLPDEAELREPDGDPYIKGKLLPVTTRYWLQDRVNRVDVIYHDLPEHLRANRPEDVGTVVWLNCTRTVRGSYSPTEKAYQSICWVTLIDLELHQIIARETFEGDPPPRVIHQYEGTGSRPTEAIVKYLEGLPLR